MTKHRRIRPSAIAGMTDYLGATVEQIHEHVGEWLELVRTAQQNLRGHLSRVDSEASRLAMPDDIKDYIDGWLDQLAKFAAELERLHAELLGGVESRHCATMLNLYSRSELMDKTCVAQIS